MSPSIQVPDTIQGIIAARMDRLEESLKRIMQVASVIGREFAFRILETITEMKEDLKSDLVNLQGLEFIYEKSLFPELGVHLQARAHSRRSLTTACSSTEGRRFTRR